MQRLAVVPTDPIKLYLAAGYNEKWLQDYFNPSKFFDKVYVLSPWEGDDPDLFGMKAINTKPDQFQARLKELKIDVVRAYGGFNACDVACRNKIKGVPVVVSVHDTNPRLLWDSIAKADLVWCMSHIVRELVLTKFPFPERVWVLPNRINDDVMHTFRREELLDIEAKYPFKYRILHVGRKVQQKNLDTMIKALSILGKEYCLIAIGKGETREYLKLAHDQGVSQQCFFVESIEHDELARYYSLADCMCTPSRWEGFGIVFIEALACGTVVVTSDIAPMKEYIEHGKNGLLIKDYENPQAIAEIVKVACTDGQVRKNLKSNARKSIDRFEQSRVDALEVEYYKKALKMNGDGEFRMSVLEQILSSPLGSRTRYVLPVPVKRAILSLVRGNLVT